MNITEYARILLEGRTLEDKLLSSQVITDHCYENGPYQLPAQPGREKRIDIGHDQLKFPRKSSLHLPERRAMALHFFANHELMAIEMMAAALLLYPDNSEEMIQFKNGLLPTIADEQKHLKLYLNRMKELKVELGDYPLNDFFWKQMPKLKDPATFYAVVALTFEQANLDFARYYQSVFSEVEDPQSAKIMQIIHDDEVVHVARGQKWLNQWKSDKTLWEYYLSLLPENMTPARAKGISFDFEGRIKAGLSEDFIEEVNSYRDPFKVINRKDVKL